jgi:error-prone DNA polymerase
LRSRSAFSFLAGASLPEDLVARAAALDYPVLALGDRDGVYGAPRFHKAAQRAGMRAIVGAELTLGGPVLGVGCQVSGIDPQHPTPSTQHLYLLAASRTGYQNLCTLITQAKLRAPKDNRV